MGEFLAGVAVGAFATFIVNKLLKPKTAKGSVTPLPEDLDDVVRKKL